jgi:ATP-binding cassette subfamily B multidrug efflux pump
MRELSSLNKYFSKYKLRFSLGIVFVALANIFAVLPPVVVRSVLDQVYENISMYNMVSGSQMAALFAKTIMNTVMIGGILLLAFALTRGIFMFFMRQTIIVMSRHIEFDQKNEIYRQYQRLETSFFKSHSTGDLMSRISEDVSRVRMYTGPAIMYTLNLVVLSIMSIWGMLRVNVELTLYALFFLPLLAFSMIKINAVINKKSSQIQGQLGKLTSLAQETYSGIRVVKSYVQEQNIQDNFEKHSRNYRKSNLNLAKTEAMYTPLMGVFIGLSLILTVFIGGRMVVNNEISVGNIAEFIIYITMLTFPVSTLGWTSSIVQRAAASQKRINDFLKMNPSIENPEDAYEGTMKGAIHFEKVSFTYPHSSITALSDFSLSINPGEKVAIIGKTGSGKSTISHLLLRMYDVSSGKLTIDDIDVKKWNLQHLRNQISYVPQEVFLFSDTIASNIAFGTSEPNNQEVEHFAQVAQIDKEIRSLQNQYDTIVGERGVMLSGGQKQRVSIARALIKPHQILILDDSISAVDNNTEQAILNNLKTATADKTVIIITHRLFKNWNFDKIIVMENGKIIEAGTHETLLAKNGYYSDLYQYQILQND